jgi:hypothetical protein
VLRVATGVATFRNSLTGEISRASRPRWFPAGKDPTPEGGRLGRGAAMSPANAAALPLDGGEEPKPNHRARSCVRDVGIAHA